MDLSIFMVVVLFAAPSAAVRTWPGGTYGLPKAKNGCPMSPKTKWTTGWRFEDTEDSNPYNTKSQSFHLDAVVGADVNRTFCMKVKNNETAEWPQGQYCIFKKGDCPKGFQEGYIFWDDENYKNFNKKGGTLPDGVYDMDTLIYYCCRVDGDKLTPVSLPVISAFYLKAFNSSECQRVEGAIATVENIGFDNQDQGNKDRQNGSYPYRVGIRDHRIYYCYYESCHYTYSLNNGEIMEFTSPKFSGEGYPLAQRCTWRFVAPKKKIVHVVFLEVDIKKDDSISIYGGWDTSGGKWTIDKEKPPSSDGYAVDPFLFMEFVSNSSDSSRNRSQGFRAIFKVDDIKELTSPSPSPSPSVPDWPSGTYGLPCPTLKCPRSGKVTWSTGWRFQDTEDKNPNNYHSESFHMDASIMKNDLNRSFCIAMENKGARAWPKGQYCIYKKGACPKGLTEGYIFFDDENDKNQNKMGGVLPDGVYDDDTKIFYCCRTDGDKLEPVSLPVSSAFYLMAYNGPECQQVKGAIATKEYIRYDNEDRHNRDAMSGTYPYQQVKKITIAYCYYEACHFTISEKSQEFMSPRYLDGGYPKLQFCTWRFLVQKKTQQTEQVLIKFPEFHLQKGGDGDVVRMYSGWDEKAPLLAEFNGDQPPPAEGVASNSPVVYLVFTSGSHGKSRGFRGLFLNQKYNASAVPAKPITLPIKTTTKPANQSLNVSASPATHVSKSNSTNQSLNVSASPATHVSKSNSMAPSSAAQGKQTGSAPVNVIIPIMIAFILVAALVTVYCIRRKRLERRVRKRLGRSQTELVNSGGYSYHDLKSQENNSTAEL